MRTTMSCPDIEAAAAPARLADVEWLREHRGDPEVLVVEVGVDSTAYHQGHVPGAVALSWLDELSDPERRGVLSHAHWEGLLSSRGVLPDTHLVLYGDDANMFAAYAFWVARFYGHRAVSLLDGGRQAWLAAGEPLELLPVERARTRYVSGAGPCRGLRALRDDLLAVVGGDGRGDRGGRVALVDCRSEDEYAGRHDSVVHLPLLRHRLGGHMPGAVNLPSSALLDEQTGRFRSVQDLERLLAPLGLQPDTDTVVYCDAGGRSSLTWFVLHELLGHERVRNYDGGWAEYGSLVGAPVERLD